MGISTRRWVQGGGRRVGDDTRQAGKPALMGLKPGVGARSMGLSGGILSRLRFQAHGRRRRREPTPAVMETGLGRGGGHEVSILRRAGTGVLGACPRVKTSMMRMRPPQQGQAG